MLFFNYLFFKRRLQSKLAPTNFRLYSKQDKQVKCIGSCGFNESLFELWDSEDWSHCKKLWDFHSGSSLFIVIWKPTKTEIKFEYRLPYFSDHYLVSQVVLFKGQSLVCVAIAFLCGCRADFHVSHTLLTCISHLPANVIWSLATWVQEVTEASRTEFILVPELHSHSQIIWLATLYHKNTYLCFDVFGSLNWFYHQRGNDDWWLND